MFLGIGETVRSAQFAWFVDIDREATRHLRSADFEALDLRAAPSLAPPNCVDAPAGFGFFRVPPDPLDQAKQVIDIDAVDDSGFGGLRLGSHHNLLLPGWWDRFAADYWSVASAACMRPPWFSVIRPDNTLPKCGCWAPG